jgi:hypothetical protein
MHYAILKKNKKQKTKNKKQQKQNTEIPKYYFNKNTRKNELETRK